MSQRLLCSPTQASTADKPSKANNLEDLKHMQAKELVPNSLFHMQAQHLLLSQFQTPFPQEIQ